MNNTPTPSPPTVPDPGPTHSDALRKHKARQNRWRRPLSSRWDRLRAWMNMLFVDHGIVRLVHLNLHQFAPGVWRAGQPAPGQIRAFARRGGRSVVTLRAGRSFGSLPLEIEACDRAGLNFHTLVIRSRGLPSPDDVRAAAELFRNVERPVLLHCKSGADRAGMAAALWLMLAEDRPAAEARQQLAFKYGHIRLSKTGVLDAFFDTYQRDTDETPMSLIEWVETRYDPDQILASFSATPLGTLIGDRLLRRE